MAADKKAGEGAGPKDVKQKAIIGVVAVIVLIIGWQLVGIMGGGGGSPKPAAPQQPARPAAPQGLQQISAGAPGAAPAAPGQPQPAADQQQNAAPRQLPVQFNAELIKLQQETEAKYIAALNQLQMLKLQRDIEQIKQAIANSKLATVTAENSITDLLTKPTAGQPQVSYNANAAAAAAAAAVPAAATTEAAPAPAPPPPPPVMPDVPYTVMSISQQGSRWTAVISNEGKLYNVKLGDTLPVDGSVVDSIVRDGVILLKDGHKRKITIVSPI